MREKGLTLVELMVSMSVMLIIFGIIASTYIITQRLWRGGFTQITFQSTGRVALDKIARNLRSAISADELDSGNRIRFTLDPNRTYNNAGDDVTCEYYVSGTGIIYDPNVNISGDESVILRNVYKESDIKFFQISGKLAVVTFKVYKDDAFYGAKWSSMTTSADMRSIRNE